MRPGSADLSRTAVITTGFCCQQSAAAEDTRQTRTEAAALAHEVLEGESNKHGRRIHLGIVIGRPPWAQAEAQVELCA